MSIVPSASDQMGPGGGWNFGSPSVSYRRDQKGLLDSPELAHFVVSGITGLALGGLRTGGTFVAGLMHWRMHHHQENQDSIWHQLDDLVNPPVVVDSPAVLPDLTPVGGGGPGGIPNLHRPPPSIEETGKLISNPPMVGDVSSSSKNGALSARVRCPYHWRYRGRTDSGWDRGYWTLHYPRGPRCVLRKGHSGPHRK